MDSCLELKAAMSAPASASAFPAWLTPRNLLITSVAVAVTTIVLKTLAWYVTGSVGLLSDAIGEVLTVGEVDAVETVLAARFGAPQE
jgi:hypothetical protein